MKNRSSIESIIIHLRWEFGGFDSGVNEFKMLLLNCGFPKSKLNDFILPATKKKGQSIHYQKLREIMMANEEFLMRFASQLYLSLERDKKNILEKNLLTDKFVLENKKFYKDRIIFEITYSQIDRVIRVNKQHITNLRLANENDSVFDYLCRHPNQKISIRDKNITDDETKIKMTKQPNDIVKNFKFKGMARKLFFPTVRWNCIEMRNPIWLSELKKRGIRENIELKELFPFLKDKKGQI
jgi:hypothetical protein